MLRRLNIFTHAYLIQKKLYVTSTNDLINYFREDLGGIKYNAILFIVQIIIITCIGENIS